MEARHHGNQGYLQVVPWGLQESLAVQVLADMAPEGTVPVDRASEGRDRERSLGLPGESQAVRIRAAHIRLLVGRAPLGLGCSLGGVHRTLAEGVHRHHYEVGWSHPLWDTYSCPGT